MPNAPELHAPTLLHLAHVFHGVGMAAMGQDHRIPPPRPAPADLHRPTVQAMAGLLTHIGSKPPQAMTGAGGPAITGPMAPPSLPAEARVPQGLMSMSERPDGS